VRPVLSCTAADLGAEPAACAVNVNMVRPLTSSSGSPLPLEKASLIPSVGCWSGTLSRAQFTCSVAALDAPHIGKRRMWNKARPPAGNEPESMGIRRGPNCISANLSDSARLKPR
jgi:hypothetical protein